MPCEICYTTATMKKVLITGTFDIIHPGHRRLLAAAKRRGGFLTVVIARDQTVYRVKGYYPYFTDVERAKNLRQLSVADRVRLGGTSDKLSIIEAEQPNVLCLGYDQRAFTKNLEKQLAERGLRPRIVRMPKYPAGRFRTGGLHAAGLVALKRIDPTIITEPRYATKQNVLKHPLYHNKIVLTRKHIALKLTRVQQRLCKRGLGLKVWDSYRPLAVQRQLWQFKPDERYIGRPSTGPYHTRAAAVDLTLVDRRGRQLLMPSGFDDFSPRAHRDDPSHNPTALRNMLILEREMKRVGFVPLPTEWWHYTDPRWKSYPVLDIAI